MLGAPPAFVLSQDQTLNLILLKRQKDVIIIYSEQLWRCNHRFVVWITFNLDSQKKSGFRSFAYSILFNFQVSFMSNRSALKLSFESLSVGSRRLVTAYLLYHTVFRLSSTFLKLFWKSFFRKLSLPAKLFSNLHKVLASRLTSDTIFKLLCRSFDSRLTRQLNYNTTVGNNCQRFFFDLDTCLFLS